MTDPTLKELHERIMAIEQFLMDKEEYPSDVPWFNTGRVVCRDDETTENVWKVIK